jgi:regulator of sirC expression with transglutaminase-like and TPR domain
MHPIGYRTVSFLSALAAVALLASVATADPPDRTAADLRTFPRPTTLDALLDLPAESIDLAWAALLVERPLFEGSDPEPVMSVVDELARAAATRVSSRRGTERKLRALSWHLFVRNRFRSDTSRTSGRAHSFRVTVARRAGVCFGLAVLYAAVGQRLGLPVRLGELPGHVIVRCEDGERIFNVETTERGRLRATRRYRRDYGLREPGGPRTLDHRAAVALMLLQTGGALYEAGKARAGGRALRRALEIDPENARAWYKMGLVHEAAGEPEREEACYTRSLDLRPDDPVVWGARGALRHEQGRDEEATRDFERMLRIPARASSVWLTTGASLRGDGLLGPACRCYARVLAGDPAREREVTAQIRGFERAVGERPAAVAARLRLGWLLFGLDRAGETAALLRKAAPAEREACRDAVRAYRRSLLATGSSEPVSWRFAGLALMELGDLRRGADCLAKADALGRALRR